MELVNTGNISKCQELMRTGLPGSIVTVSSVRPDGQPVQSYEAVFVGWTSGYTKFDYPMRKSNGDTDEKKPPAFPSVIGALNDAIVMKSNGQLEITSIRSLRFKVQ